MEIPGYETKIAQIKNWLGSGSINIFGRPYAGKDTHGRELAKLFGAVIIGGGDILRSKFTPSHIQAHIAKGSLTPTEEFLRIILPYFAKEEYRDKPLILSSVGRWHGEEAAVLEAAAESGHTLKMVIWLKISEEEVIRRWEESQKSGDRGHRRDDDKQALNHRLQEFRDKTVPVMNFYRDQGMLLEIDGMPERTDVLKDMLDQLAIRASQN